MKASEAINVLNMLPADTEVELRFPTTASKFVSTVNTRMTEGEMAALPMYPGQVKEQFSWDGHP